MATLNRCLKDNSRKHSCLGEFPGSCLTLIIQCNQSCISCLLRMGQICTFPSQHLYPPIVVTRCFLSPLSSAWAERPWPHLRQVEQFRKPPMHHMPFFYSEALFWSYWCLLTWAYALLHSFIASKQLWYDYWLSPEVNKPLPAKLEKDLYKGYFRQLSNVNNYIIIHFMQSTNKEEKRNIHIMEKGKRHYVKAWQLQTPWMLSLTSSFVFPK